MNKLYSLSVRDCIKGIVMAVIGGVLVAFYTGIQAGSIDWKSVGMAGLTAGLSYVIKNYFTDENGKFGGMI